MTQIKSHYALFIFYAVVGLVGYGRGVGRPKNMASKGVHAKKNCCVRGGGHSK